MLLVGRTQDEMVLGGGALRWLNSRYADEQHPNAIEPPSVAYVCFDHGALLPVFFPVVFEQPGVVIQEVSEHT